MSDSQQRVVVIPPSLLRREDQQQLLNKKDRDSESDQCCNTCCIPADKPRLLFGGKILILTIMIINLGLVSYLVSRANRV
jgi:hypothetical protein